MTSEEVEKRVRQVIQDSAGLDPTEITLSSTADDLGLDSLDVVEIIMNLEEVFKIEIHENDVEFQNLKTVKDLIEFIPLHAIENKLDRR